MGGNHDQRIDTVLNALQQAEPNPAMQDGILAALRAAEGTQGQPGRVDHWLRTAPRSATAMPWLAAAALLLAAGGTLLLHHRSSPQSTTGAAPDVAFVSVDPGTKSDTVPTTWMPHVSQRHGIAIDITAQTHVSEARRGTPSELVQERSFPAPPLPLTEQERLLLRLVDREPPRQLAQLASDSLHANSQLEKDAFNEFFAPRSPLPGQEEPLQNVSPTAQP